MRLLLDSHVVLWYDIAALRSISDSKTIQAAEEVFVSAASFWELTIKQSQLKLHLRSDLKSIGARAGFKVLAITPEHGVAAGELPLHHRDPFDRMLVAQAMLENLTLVTHDPTLLHYDVPVLLV